MTCKKISSSATKICSGNFKHKIILQYAVSTPSNDPNSNAGSSFVDILTTWAMVKTSALISANVLFFDETNLDAGSNIDFYIRYTATIDWSRDIWVLYDGNRYKRTAVENIDHENKIVRISCNIRGDSTVAGNQR